MRAYFDHAATSPMPAAVLAAYTAALQTVGNPASQHTDGQQARDLLESAREKIARALNVTPAEVIFTSGGTEAINLALKGLYWARNKTAKRPVILVPEAEHHATIDTVEWLAVNQGAELLWVPVTAHGVVTPEALADAIATAGAANVALFTLLWANNEIGTVQPVSELSALAKKHGIPTHVDAVAALGQFDLRGSGAAAMSLSAHKIGGPVSSGALIVARDVKLETLIHGGSQQRFRSGTQDAAAAAAFAKAFELANNDLPAKQQRLWEVQDRLIKEISALDTSAVLRGVPPVNPTSSLFVLEDNQQPLGCIKPPRIYSNVHFTFPGLQGDSLLFLLDMAGVSAATGSACTAGVAEVSHVMLALGLAPEVAAGALRFTFSADTTDEEVDMLLAALPAALASARKAGFTVDFRQS